MKKIIALLAAVCMIFILAACANNKPQQKTPSSSSSSSKSAISADNSSSSLPQSSEESILLDDSNSEKDVFISDDVWLNNTYIDLLGKTNGEIIEIMGNNCKFVGYSDVEPFYPVANYGLRTEEQGYEIQFIFDFGNFTTQEIDTLRTEDGGENPETRIMVRPNYLPESLTVKAISINYPRMPMREDLELLYTSDMLSLQALEKYLDEPFYSSEEDSLNFVLSDHFEFVRHYSYMGCNFGIAKLKTEVERDWGNMDFSHVVAYTDEEDQSFISQLIWDKMGYRYEDANISIAGIFMY